MINNNRNKYGLTERDMKTLEGIFLKYPEVREVRLFGSRAKGNFKHGSDIDFAVMDKGLDSKTISNLSFDFEESSLPYTVDVINFSTLKHQEFIEHIDRVGIVFYERWKQIKLREICTDISYGYTASANDAPVGPKFLRITDITNGIINWEKVPYCKINNKDYLKYKLEVGDIVIARTGATTGYNAIIKQEVEAVFASYLIRYKVNEKIAEPFYVGYVIQSNKFQDYVDSIAGGSAQPGANAQQFADFEFLLSPTNEQQIITSILTSLDDKINLLQRQNKTLEQLAETLFRQWFVEEASEDWKVGKVRDFACINKSSISKDYEYEYIEYLDTGSITEGIISEFQVFKLLDAPSRAQRIVRKNDLVYSLVRPIQRHYGILIEVKPNTVVSTGFCVINCHSISPFFMYLLLTIDDSVDYFDMVAEGSTSAYPSLKPSDIANFEFALPPKEKLHAFSEYTADAWNKISSNRIQIQTLTQLRDALLPKLMSGEMRVKM